MSAFVTGAAMGLLSLVGLLLASRAHGGSLHYLGLLLFLAAVGYIFFLVHKHTGRPPAEH